MAETSFGMIGTENSGLNKAYLGREILLGPEAIVPELKIPGDQFLLIGIEIIQKGYWSLKVTCKPQPLEAACPLPGQTTLGCLPQLRTVAPVGVELLEMGQTFPKVLNC